MVAKSPTTELLLPTPVATPPSMISTRKVLASSTKTAGVVVPSLLSPAPKKSRTVQFHKKVKLRRTLSRADYTTEEVGDCWYDQQTFQKMRYDCARQAKKIEMEAAATTSAMPANSSACIRRRLLQTSKASTSSTTDNTSEPKQETCSRGLENCFSGARKARTHRRQAACFSVMYEQDDQYLKGTVNLEAIAEAYKKISTECHRQARMVGARDEVEAKRCYRS